MFKEGKKRKKCRPSSSQISTPSSLCDDSLNQIFSPLRSTASTARLVLVMRPSPTFRLGRIDGRFRMASQWSMMKTGQQVERNVIQDDEWNKKKKSNKKKKQGRESSLQYAD